MKTVVEPNEIRKQVRTNYGKIATESGSCCGPECCGPENSDLARKASQMGYSESDISSAPEESNLGLGCGNPLAIASLKPGDVVLDLGSGAGFDVFLASEKVGSTGQVIGVDMTPEMVHKARANRDKIQVSNVEFRLGEIEHLPIDSDSIDVILSNCVINLSPEKEQVFRESFRVLKAGGRLAISDVVALGELDESMRTNAELISACVGGASTIDDLHHMLIDTGFVDVSIQPKSDSKELLSDWSLTTSIAEMVVSAYIEARKP